MQELEKISILGKAKPKMTGSKDKRDEKLSSKEVKQPFEQNDVLGAPNLFSKFNEKNNFIRFIFSRHKIRGFFRFFIEIFDEGLTIGLVGFAAFTFISLPILNLAKNDWNEPDNFALTITDRDGSFIGSRGVSQTEFVSVDEMPDYLIKAVLATEDRRFFEHWGIDFWGLGRALNSNVRANGVVQGGSTLSQQLAKNLFLSNERTMQRKIKEAYLALWLEINYTKKDILQLYLNRAYMGGGTFGIGTASKFYFGKNISDITLAEAAMLSGLFKAPSKFAPHINLPAARARANVVLSNLVESGFMTESETINARYNPASVVVASTDQSNSPDYFLDWIFDEVLSLSSNFSERSLTVRSTFDPRVQKAAEESVTYHLRTYGSEYNVSQASVVVLDNDGSVRAIVGGRDYGESQFNRATRGGRPAGSSFKPYVYAALLEKGLTPNSTTVDEPITWDKWSPANYGRKYSGKVDLTTALARSINTVPVRLTRQYLNGSTQPILDLIKTMGLESKISSHKTMILGVSNMTPMEQATGFNVFANGGMAGNRHGIIEIQSAEGETLWSWARNGPEPHRALSAKASANLNYMMSEVISRGSGRRAALPMTMTAGKTGTSQKNRDAWFVGFTGNYTAAVWMGNDDYTSMNARMTGGTLPAMVWQRMMLTAHQKIALKPLYGLNQSAITIARANNQPNILDDQSSGISQLLRLDVVNVIKRINSKLEGIPDFIVPLNNYIASSSNLEIH